MNEDKYRFLKDGETILATDEAYMGAPQPGRWIFVEYLPPIYKHKFGANKKFTSRNPLIYRRLKTIIKPPSKPLDCFEIIPFKKVSLNKFFRHNNHWCKRAPYHALKPNWYLNTIAYFDNNLIFIRTGFVWDEETLVGVLK